MSKPVLLSIGEKLQMEPNPTGAENSPEVAPQPESAQVSGGQGTEQPSPPAEAVTSPSAASLAEVYENLKRHQETLRDLIIEVRLLYYNLPEKERQRLEAQRERTTREVGDTFAGQIRSLDETVARLRGKP